MAPIRCPDGKYAAEGAAYLTDCSDSASVRFAVVISITVGVLIIIFCMYAVWDYWQYQVYLQSYSRPNPSDVECPPEPRRCPQRRCPERYAPSAPPGSGPDFIPTAVVVPAIPQSQCYGACTGCTRDQLPAQGGARMIPILCVPRGGPPQHYGRG